MTLPRNYPYAAFLASVVFFGWPISDAFLKMANEAGVPHGEVLLICGIGSMITISFFTAVRGKLENLRPYNFGGLIVLGLCQLAGFLCWMIALPGLPLANMYIVSFLTPMVVACMASLFLKETLGWKRASAIGAGFLGVVVAVNPSNFVLNSDAGLSYALLVGNMLCSATQMFLLRLVADKEQCESTAFYSRLIMAMGGLLLCASSGFVPLKPLVFLALCASGALGGIGWTLLAQAYRHAPAAAVAPFQYSQMIWGALIGYLFWHDVPSRALIDGAAIIILAGLYLVRHERRVSRTMPRVD